MAASERWGDEASGRLEGDFAPALWDGRRRRLFGARLRGPAEEGGAAPGRGELVACGGPRERWRITLAPHDAPLPLRGWVFLGWAPDLELRALAPRARLARLAASRNSPAWSCSVPVGGRRCPPPIGCLEAAAVSRRAGRSAPA